MGNSYQQNNIQPNTLKSIDKQNLQIPLNFINQTVVSDSSNNLQYVLSVMSYNILADSYADTFRHPQCNQETIDIAYRSNNVLKQIAILKPDIICIQEMDKYEERYEHQLKNLGYHIEIYRNRCYKSPVSIIIGWVDAKFKHTKTHRFNYQDSVLKDESFAFIKSSLPQQLFNPYFQDTSLMISELAFIENNQIKIVIANTHLYYDPFLEKVKLFQAICSLKHILNFGVNDQTNFVYCGDFNSVPDSNVVNFYLNPRLAQAKPSQYLQSKKDIEEMDKLLQIFQHSQQITDLHLQSAYAKYNQDGHPLYTNYTKGFKGTLDYIFYASKSRLRLLSILEIPEAIIELNQNKGIPNQTFPSDHLPIMAQFEIKLN